MLNVCDASPPGADDVDQVLAVGHLHLRGQLAHHLRGGGDLADRLLLDAQADGQRGDHHRRHLAAHDLPHERQHLVVEDLAVLDGALERILHGDGHRCSPSSGGRGRGGASCRPCSASWPWSAPLPLAYIARTKSHCALRYSAKVAHRPGRSAAAAPGRPVAVSISRARFRAMSPSTLTSAVLRLTLGIDQAARDRRVIALAHALLQRAGGGAGSEGERHGTGQRRRISGVHRRPSRKLPSRRVPCSVRIASGWNCTPSTAKRPMAHAHDLAVVGGGGDLELVGHAGRARWRANGSASPRTATADRGTRPARRA